MTKRIEHPRYSAADHKRLAIANLRNWAAECQASADAELAKRGVVSARTADALSRATAMLTQAVRS